MLSDKSTLPLVFLLALLALFHSSRALAIGAPVERALCEPSDISSGDTLQDDTAMSDISDSDGLTECPALPDAGALPGAREPTEADAGAPQAGPSDRVPSDAAGVTDRGAAAPPSADEDARAAPMCDSSAASIAAVPEVPLVDRGSIEPGRCDIERLLARLRSNDRKHGANVTAGSARERPEPPPATPRAAPLDAALFVGQRWPLPRRTSIVSLGQALGITFQPGHRARIDRPPLQG